MSQMTNPILSERVQRRLKRTLKRILHKVVPSQGATQPAFVLGYGRSGTTMIIDALEHDWRIDVYQENDRRIAADFMLKHEAVLPEIGASRAPVTVMKPILNSFEAKKIMGAVANAKVLWMVRGVDPVVRSALKKFGPAVAGYLQNAVKGKDDGSWIVKTIPEATLATIRRLDTHSLSETDWMALVWWSVNSVATDPNIHNSERFLLVWYEELLKSPESWMTRVYEHIGLPFRQDSVRWIGAGSPNPPAPIELSPIVRNMCDELTHALTH